MNGEPFQAADRPPVSRVDGRQLRDRRVAEARQVETQEPVVARPATTEAPFRQAFTAPRWSIYGAERAQTAAIRRKRGTLESRLEAPDPLRSVAASCAHNEMVRRRFESDRGLSYLGW